MTLAAYDAWLRNQPQRAAARLDAALTSIRSPRCQSATGPILILARVYAMAGRPDRARRCSHSSRRSRTRLFSARQTERPRSARRDRAGREAIRATRSPNFGAAMLDEDGRPATDGPRGYPLRSRPRVRSREPTRFGHRAVRSVSSHLAGTAGSTTTCSRSPACTSDSASCTTRRAIVSAPSRICPSSSSCGRTPIRSCSRPWLMQSVV